ncbi:MAG: CHASE2 domain-containing protein, partial [Pseudomonadota bacterium]
MRIRFPRAIPSANAWRLRLWAMAAVALCVFTLEGLTPRLLSGIEEGVGDTLWRFAAASAQADAQERRLVVVDIDEASLAKLGPWPWPRERLAELARRLAALGAGLQIYDVVLPDPRPGDAALAAEFARNPVVLAQIFALDPETPAALGRPLGALKPGAPPCRAPLPQATGFIANAPAFAAVEGLTAGHITPRVARDGAVRRLPALICFEGRAYPALGLAALLKAAGVESEWTLAPGSTWLDPAWRLTHPALPGIAVPLDGDGDIRLSYRLPRRAFVSMSAADVLAGQVPPELFRGAWVLIGATAFGIGDAVPTPHGGALGGVEVHAQFLAALLDGRLPHTPLGAPWLRLLLGLAGAAALLAALRVRR